jgi:hypothetical protein
MWITWMKMVVPSAMVPSANQFYTMAPLDSWASSMAPSRAMPHSALPTNVLMSTVEHLCHSTIEGGHRAFVEFFNNAN